MSGKIKNAIIVNMISIIMFIISIALIVMFDATIIGIIGIVYLIFFIIGSNYMLFLYTKNIKKTLAEADKHHIFTKQRNILCQQIESLKLRQEFISDPATESIVIETYGKIENQINKNIKIAIKFIQSYDTITRPSTETLDELITENQNMIDKLNELIDAMLDIDKSISNVDLSSIDDYINSIQEITK